MASPLAASEEKSNGTRLARLLIDGGTHVLREIFTTIHPYRTLRAVLNANVGRLQTLKTRRVLHETQWKKLFPSSGDTADPNTFDVTLLHLLLREICQLNAPSTGWHIMPAPSDTSREANIVRIKCFRNELVHNFSTGIASDDFEGKWNKISASLLALGMDPVEIQRLKIEPIDHNIESMVEEEVTKWKLEFEPRIENLEQDVQQMKGEITSIQQIITPDTNREHINCLPDDVSDVFGRQEEIQHVTELIQRGQVPAVVITGGPGFGETTVAKKVCYELAANREYKTAVLYCSLRSKKTLMDVAISMILVCNEASSKPPANPQNWLLFWSKQQRQRVTFVLDNADDILESKDVNHFKNILRDMRHSSRHNVNFVITSRRAFKVPDLRIEEKRLDSLSPEDARKVVLTHVNDPDIKQRLVKTETLVTLCGCLPLALCIVGSLLSDFTEDELIHNLTKKPLRVLRDDESDCNSVENAIKMSFEYLPENEQEALVVMSVFPGSFDSDAARAVLSPSMNSSDQSVSVLRSLKNRSLVQQPASYRYEIHPLIQAYAKKIGEERCSRLLYEIEELACFHFVSLLARNADVYWNKNRCKEALDSFNKDRPNFEHFLHFFVTRSKRQVPRFVRTFSEIFCNRLWQKCMYLAVSLLPSVFIQLLEELVHLNALGHGEYVGERVALLCLLGLENRKIGKRDKYKKCFEEAMEEYSPNSTQFEKDKESEVFFLNSYARFLSEEEKICEAKERFADALKICEEHLPEYSVQRAATLHCSGRENNRHHERDEAEKKLNEALSLLREHLGNHVMTAEVCSALSDFYLFHGEKDLGSEEDRQKSFNLNREALEMMELLGMRDHKVCILILANLGLSYQLQGNWEEAMKLYQESLCNAERELEANHRWKIYVKTQMAFWWRKKGSMEEARKLKNEAMKMSEDLRLPDNQPPNKFLLQKILP